MKTVAMWLARLLLGGVFAYAAAGKLRDPSAFVADIDHYHMVPHTAALVLGIYLPWLELACAGAMILRWRERAALLLATSLCLVFSAALASAWFRDLDISCGCFGSNGHPSSLPYALARAAGLTVVALILFRTTRVPKTTLPIDQAEAW